ncbi:unnamed protein product [Brassica oleracea var. botrytis]
MILFFSLKKKRLERDCDRGLSNRYQRPAATCKLATFLMLS